MSNQIIEAETVLAIDVGSIHTRALLFDLVDGQYRFIGASRAPSTSRAPFFDISEGVFQAIHSLEQITGRSFLDDFRLVIPSNANGYGVDQLVITFTSPQALKVAVLGLLDDVSMQSARKLIHTAHCQIVEQIGLNDRRKPEMQVDALIKADPDLVLIAGGTENGATRSVVRLIDLVSLALQMVAKDDRPQVIYAGNQALKDQVEEAIAQFTTLQISPNLRPEIDLESLGPAQEMFSETIRNIRIHQIGGLQSYATICTAEPADSSEAFGRMIRYLSQINNSQKGVLGIDLGASRTTIAAAREGNLEMMVSPCGLGVGLKEVLETTPLEEFMRWLSMPIPIGVVRDILAQKTLFPEMVPASNDTLAVEQAVARRIISMAVSGLQKRNSAYEPILASGQLLTQSTPGQSLLMLLDSIQPVGVTTFILDPHGLTPALGAIARFNPVLPVQVVESNAYINLGTVLSPICSARFDTPVLQVRVEYESSQEINLEIRQGTVTQLPITPGQTAKIHLRPLRPMTLDPNRRDAPRSYKITGGVCGAVIDTRGRPIRLPKDTPQRRDLLKKWALAVNA